LASWSWVFKSLMTFPVSLMVSDTSLYLEFCASSYFDNCSLNDLFLFLYFLSSSSALINYSSRFTSPSYL
jgi:hypothetical protein